METISALLVNSPHKGQWCGALMFPLIGAWINGSVNNREAGDLGRHCANYDVIVMLSWMMTSWYGRATSSPCPMWGNPRATGSFWHPKDKESGALESTLLLAEQTIGSDIIWDDFLSIWRHCNVCNVVCLMTCTAMLVHSCVLAPSLLGFWTKRMFFCINALQLFMPTTCYSYDP